MNYQVGTLPKKKKKDYQVGTRHSNLGKYHQKTIWCEIQNRPNISHQVTIPGQVNILYDLWPKITLTGILYRLNYHWVRQDTGESIGLMMSIGSLNTCEIPAKHVSQRRRMTCIKINITGLVPMVTITTPTSLPKIRSCAKLHISLNWYRSQWEHSLTQPSSILVA